MHRPPLLGSGADDHRTSHIGNYGIAFVSRKSYLCALGGDEGRGRGFLNATSVYVDVLPALVDCYAISQMMVEI